MVDNCTLVYDVVQDRERYVKNTYVRLYPKMYKPVWVDGKRIYYGKKLAASTCGVKT